MVEMQASSLQQPPLGPLHVYGALFRLRPLSHTIFSFLLTMMNR